MCRVTLCDERSGLVKMELPTRLSVLFLCGTTADCAPIHIGPSKKPCVLHLW